MTKNEALLTAIDKWTEGSQCTEFTFVSWQQEIGSKECSLCDYAKEQKNKLNFSCCQCSICPIVFKKTNTYTGVSIYQCSKNWRKCDISAERRNYPNFIKYAKALLQEIIEAYNKDNPNDQR